MFDKIVFSPKFLGYGGFAAHDGNGGGTNGTLTTFNDRYGLKYTVLDKITLTTVKDLKWKKGQLSEIQYTIPDNLRDRMLFEQN